MANRTLVRKDHPSFKQQNLPAWQPILTAGTVLPTFFLIAVAFVPIGIGLLMSSTTVQEKIIDYTDCESSEEPTKTCASIIPKKCTCKVGLELDQDFRKDVYIYYGLSNFYQNHRRYVKSRDDNQLLGSPEIVSSECDPFQYAWDQSKKKRLPIAPCGAIANSKFNDTFKLSDITGKNIPVQKTGIAWSSDKRIRFQNPTIPDGSKDLALAFANTTKPPNWPKPVYNLDPKRPEDNGFQNEALIVWMRTAALPTFRKLYGILVVTKTDYLPKGSYIVEIEYNYPVTMFNGRKRFIMSNTSWLGGKNHFLGIAYIVVGGICFLISAFFLFIHKKYGKLPSEIIRINQTTPYLAS